MIFHVSYIKTSIEKRLGFTIENVVMAMQQSLKMNSKSMQNRYRKKTRKLCIKNPKMVPKWEPTS